MAKSQHHHHHYFKMYKNDFSLYSWCFCIYQKTIDTLVMARVSKKQRIEFSDQGDNDYDFDATKVTTKYGVVFGSEYDVSMCREDEHNGTYIDTFTYESGEYKSMELPVGASIVKNSGSECTWIIMYPNKDRETGLTCSTTICKLNTSTKEYSHMLTLPNVDLVYHSAQCHQESGFMSIYSRTKSKDDSELYVIDMTTTYTDDRIKMRYSVPSAHYSKVIGFLKDAVCVQVSSGGTTDGVTNINILDFCTGKESPILTFSEDYAREYHMTDSRLVVIKSNRASGDKNKTLMVYDLSSSCKMEYEKDFQEVKRFEDEMVMITYTSEGTSIVLCGYTLTGYEMWKTPLASFQKTKHFKKLHLDVDCQNGVVLVGDHNETNNETNFVAIESKTGDILWSRVHDTCDQMVHLRFNRVPDMLYFRREFHSLTDVLTFSDDSNELHALERNSGIHKWSTPYISYCETYRVKHKDLIIVIDGILQRINSDTGKVVWMKKLSDIAGRHKFIY